jgi:very-short-patch-repair endonuclease
MRSASKTHTRAKVLRQTMSLPERLLWVRLRGRDADKPTFRRQHPIGPYVADFFCSEVRLCIEVDGYGHTHQDRFAHDQRRTAYLESIGVRVVRLTAKEVLDDPDEAAHRVVQIARQALRAPPPSATPTPPPHAGEER